MKKFLLIASIALMPFSAHAQFYSLSHDGGAGVLYLTNFKDGLKGQYGLGWDIYFESGFGISFSLLTDLGMSKNTNYSSFTGVIGPSYTYFFSDDVCFSFPLQLGVTYGPFGDFDYKKSKIEDKAIFSLLCNPYMGFYAGPVQFKIGPYLQYLAHKNEGADKAFWGAHVGISFDF